MDSIAHDRPTKKARRKQQDVVYLAAPLPLYSTSAYDTALTHITARHPHADIRSARELWHSNAHWRRTYEAVLADVTCAYILVPDTGLVGRGVYIEWAYLQQLGTRCTALLPGDEECTCCTLDVVNASDWQRYAMVRCLDGEHTPCTCASIPAAEAAVACLRTSGGVGYGWAT
jgi:hypothetical protein